MFCKMLSKDDYEGELKPYADITKRESDKAVASRGFRVDNIHRMWEYAQVLGLIDKVIGAKNTGFSFLDVGGSYSPLGYIVKSLYPSSEVTVLDLQDTDHYSKDDDLNFIKADFQRENFGRFDVVVSISVIEHVPDYYSFWANMLASSIQATMITCDFHPSGKSFMPSQQRTFNKEVMYTLAGVAKGEGFQVTAPLKYGLPLEVVLLQYTFASLSVARMK